MADEFAKRLEVIAPPPIQELLANQKKEKGEDMPPPKQPSPAEQMQMQAMQLELENKQLTNEKIKVDMAVAMQGAQSSAMEGQQQGELDPSAVIKNEADLRAAEIAQLKGQLELQKMDHEFQHSQRMADMEFQHSRADLASKRIAASESEVDDAVDGEVMPADRRHGESLQAMQQIAEAFQAGMEAIAKAMMTPRKIDVERVKGVVVGAQSVPTQTLN